MPFKTIKCPKCGVEGSFEIVALDEERGATKAFEFTIKQSAYNDIMYRRRLRKD